MIFLQEIFIKNRNLFCPFNQKYWEWDLRVGKMILFALCNSNKKGVKMDISCNFKGKICEVNIQALPETRKRYNKPIDVMVLHLTPSCQVWIDAQKGIRLIINIGGWVSVFLDLYNKAFRVSFKYVR